MATRKNDLLESENQTAEMTEAADSSQTTFSPGAETEADTSSADSFDEDATDLNELLDGMDQDPPGNTVSDATDGETSEGNSAETGEITSPDTAATNEQPDAGEPSVMEEPPSRPKRAARKKKAAEAPAPDQGTTAAEEETAPGMAENPPGSDTEVSEEATPLFQEPPEPESPQPAPRNMPTSAPGNEAAVLRNAPVLTIRNREDVTTDTEQEDITWHEIRNAYRTRRILTGKLGGIEQTDNKKTIAIVDYKGFRVIIPLKEMMIQMPATSTELEYSEMMLRQNKILNNMLGADIDFIVRGIDSKTYSVVASRREAMLRKRQIFYMESDTSGMYRVYEGRVVQARVIAVAEKVIRVEVFGVETSIMARDLAWDWIGDAHERFSVGDEVLVRVQKVRREVLEDIGIKVDIKSISQNTSQDNLQKCRIQSKYVGKVTDVHKGVVYIRLSNGVNAIAHSCYDYRTPGKKDDVSFAVTRLDVERGVAVGIITRIIRQNL